MERVQKGADKREYVFSENPFTGICITAEQNFILKAEIKKSFYELLRRK